MTPNEIKEEEILAKLEDAGMMDTIYFVFKTGYLPSWEVFRHVCQHNELHRFE